jgi:methylmalonyl-CoA mutase
MPVHGTIASQFNDPGTNTLYRAIIDALVSRCSLPWTSSFAVTSEMSEKIYIIPPDRTRYLAELVEESKRYDAHVHKQASIARALWQVKGTIAHIEEQLATESTRR